jgi:hypothetical protein
MRTAGGAIGDVAMGEHLTPLAQRPQSRLPSTSDLRALMTNADESLDAHAERLWLERAVGAPDAWRLRATNAAGLLSAAAAATIVGVALLDRLTVWARASLVAAAGFYAVSVIAFLVASLWPPPRRGEKESVDFTGDIWAYSEREIRPVRCATRIGAGAAITAILATTVTLLLAALTPRGGLESATISPASTHARRALEAACPGIPDAFTAEIEYTGAERIRVAPSEGTCGTAAEVELLRTDVIVFREAP